MSHPRSSSPLQGVPLPKAYPPRCPHKSILPRRSTAWQLHDDCLTTAWILPDFDWCIPDECLMNAWWLPDDRLTTAWRLIDNCPTTAWWFVWYQLRFFEIEKTTRQQNLQAKNWYCATPTRICVFAAWAPIYYGHRPIRIKKRVFVRLAKGSHGRIWRLGRKL